MVLELYGSTVSDEENIAVGGIGKDVSQVVRVIWGGGGLFQSL